MPIIHSDHTHPPSLSCPLPVPTNALTFTHKLLGHFHIFLFFFITRGFNQVTLISTNMMLSAQAWAPEVTSLKTRIPTKKGVLSCLWFSYVPKSDALNGERFLVSQMQ